MGLNVWIWVFFGGGGESGMGVDGVLLFCVLFVLWIIIIWMFS